MARPECDPSENIVRAITNASWDEKEGRAYSKLFEGRGTSVSRLCKLDLEALFVIFKQQLGQYPSKVLWAGEINIGVMQDVGRNFEHPIELTVEEDPLPNNPAHAEIPQKISRGLSKRIRDKLTMHKAP